MVSASRYIIDSFGWIEYFSDGPLAGKYARYIEKATPRSFLTPTMVIYEVAKKIMSHYGKEEALTVVAHIECLTKVVDLDHSIAILAAELSIKEGMHMADAIVLATGRIHSATVVTSDPHFRGKDGVVMIE